jgi:chromosome segregation ATPase
MVTSIMHVQLVLEMRKTKLLDLHLQETNSVLGTTRSLMGGIFASRDKVQAVANQIKLLENRLEKAYIKYNQSVTHTKQLRDQINNLRKERIMFQDIDRNLEKELTKLKKEMGETIQLANVAFEAKEKAIAEMNVLKVQAEKEQQGFEEEWKQLAAIIEEDKRERVRQG